MSTRLDLVLQKFPDHEIGVRLLAERDPSGNFKYLDWGARMLAARQALAAEVADVIDLFHQFSGQRVSHGVRSSHRVRPDIYSYRPQDLAALRDLLLKLKRARDKKRRQREKLYRIEGSIEAAVVYDSPDLIVRHIQNKQASVHYGLRTKWCIAMSREGHFENYESHNATFFFFERKTPVGDAFDKVALMIPRNGIGRDIALEAFNSLDERVDMLSLAKVHGVRVFDIFRDIYECSERYPGSAMFHVYAGNATSEQLESVVANLKFMNPYETRSVLEAICCNDAAPSPLLEEIARSAVSLSTAAWKRWRGRSHRRRLGTRGDKHTRELMRTIAAALVIHPQTPPDLRDRLIKDLRRRHISIHTIHRTDGRDGQVGVVYQRSVNGMRVDRGRYSHRYRRRRRETVSGLLAHVRGLVRMATRARKRLKLLKQKLAKKKKKQKKAGR